MKKMKHFTSILCILMMILSFSTVTYADKQINLYIAEQLVETDQPPVLINDRTLVPIRVIAENDTFYCTVTWDEENQTVKIATQYLMCIEIKIGSNTAIKYFENFDNYDFETHSGIIGKDNIQEIPLDVPAQVINDRTMVPIRFVAEALNAEVQWHGASSSVLIDSPNTYQKLNEQ